MKHRIVAHVTAVAFLCLAGCAADISRTPTTFVPATSSETVRSIQLSKELSVTPSSGFERRLKGGSTWSYVGRVPEGQVYRIKDDVFMLEGKHMHEAYCVVSPTNKLVGFFLPVEKAFVPVSSPVVLPIVENN